MNKKPIACLSLDLDNQWSYMKTHGDEAWKDYPSYYDIFIPHILDVLNELDIKITFFIVGLDASKEENIPWLRMLTENGHDIGNHSFNHEVWINQYTRKELEEEFDLAEAAIYNATGIKTKGFRGPGFSWSTTLLEVLHDRGYLFDSSTLPTFLGPLARMYYFWKSDFTREEKKKRESLFGPFSLGFKKLKPYYLKIGTGKKILELPLTTIPGIKLPFHMSYLLYISNISMLLMKFYLWIAIKMCKLTRTPLNFLLHPLDIIGGDKVKELAFFPGMNLPTDKKLKVFKWVLGKLKEEYDLLTMDEFAHRLLLEKTNS
jgi:peptidoglycan-N-acetylglucosamine deacetylase